MHATCAEALLDKLSAVPIRESVDPRKFSAVTDALLNPSILLRRRMYRDALEALGRVVRLDNPRFARKRTTWCILPRIKAGGVRRVHSDPDMSESARARVARYCDVKSKWVHVAKGIRVDVEVRVDPAREPNRIVLNVSPRLRIVVAEVVVEEPSLLVRILARQYLNRPPPHGLSSPSKDQARSARSPLPTALSSSLVHRVPCICTSIALAPPRPIVSALIYGADWVLRNEAPGHSPSGTSITTRLFFARSEIGDGIANEES